MNLLHNHHSPPLQYGTLTNAGKPNRLSENGRWTCCKCSVHNFNYHANCYKCGTPRSSGEAFALDAKGLSMVGAPPCDTLLIRELPASANAVTVRQAVVRFGGIEPLRVRLAASRMFAFVQMGSLVDAEVAHLKLQRTCLYINHCAVFVSFSRHPLAKVLSDGRIKLLPETQKDVLNIVDHSVQSSSQTVNTPFGNFPIFAEPDPTKFQFEQSSGYFYDPATGFYYDPKTEFYYSVKSRSWKFWCQKYRTFIDCEGGDIEMKRRLQETSGRSTDDSKTWETKHQHTVQNEPSLPSRSDCAVQTLHHKGGGGAYGGSNKKGSPPGKRRIIDDNNHRRLPLLIESESDNEAKNVVQPPLVSVGGGREQQTTNEGRKRGMMGEEENDDDDEYNGKNPKQKMLAMEHWHDEKATRTDEILAHSNASAMLTMHTQQLPNKMPSSWSLTNCVGNAEGAHNSATLKQLSEQRQMAKDRHQIGAPRQQIDALLAQQCTLDALIEQLSRTEQMTTTAKQQQAAQTSLLKPYITKSPKKEQQWQKGDRIRCLWKNVEYEAKIEEKVVLCGGTTKYLIHYVGWNQRWDEVVTEADAVSRFRTWDSSPLPPGMFIVERLCGKRMQNRRLEYKVHWEGYGPNDDTWEPANKLISDGCSWAIEEYEKKFGGTTNILANKKPPLVRPVKKSHSAK